MFNTILQAELAAGEQGSALMSFLPFILIIVVFYFFMIRPQQKQQKEQETMRKELKKGDVVMTNSGLIAKVAEVKENEVVLEVADGVKVTFVKEAIMRLYNDKK